MHMRASLRHEKSNSYNALYSGDSIFLERLLRMTPSSPAKIDVLLKTNEDTTYTHTHIAAKLFISDSGLFFHAVTQKAK